MVDNNGVFINMRIHKKERENIRNANPTKDYATNIGTLSLSIEIDGEGYVIPIKNEKRLNKNQIKEMINHGKYDIYDDSINILFQLKPVDTIEEETNPDLMNF